MSYISNRVISEANPEEDSGLEIPPEHLQEGFIENTIKKLNSYVFDTKEFVSKHNEDENMYPGLGFDIKNRNPARIYKKILDKSYKSDIPSYKNKLFQKNFLYKKNNGFFSDFISKIGGGDKPFDKKIKTKTKTPVSGKKEKNKAFIKKVMKKKDRLDILNKILSNDLEDLEVKHHNFEEIIPEIINDIDNNVSAQDNDILKSYVDKVNILKKIKETDNINQPFIDKSTIEENVTEKELFQWDNDNLKPLIISQNENRSQNENTSTNEIEENKELISSKDDESFHLNDYDSDNDEFQNNEYSNNYKKEEDNKISIDSPQIDYFNKDLNNIAINTDEVIVFRENDANQKFDDEITTLNQKIDFIDSVIERPIPLSTIETIEEELPRVTDFDVVRDIKKFEPEPFQSVNTDLVENKEIAKTYLLYVNTDNFEYEWNLLMNELKSSSFEISEEDILKVRNFIKWLVLNKEYLNIEFTSSKNPYTNSHFQLIYREEDTNTNVGDVILNIGSHQLQPIIHPIWDLVEISSPETLELYDEDHVLDSKNLTVFKMISGYYNRENLPQYRIIFNSYKKLLPKVEKEINDKISGLDELLNIMNDDNSNEIFRPYTEVLDNLRFENDNFYFNNYSKAFRKYNKNSSNIIELIFNDYFSGKISSFIGVENSETLMSTNNEIGELMNEVHERGLIGLTDCYNQYSMAMITLVISTFYLTFFNFELKLVNIKGSNEIINNLCITIRTINAQFISKNLNNDNVYVILKGFLTFLNNIHNQRLIEYENILNKSVKINTVATQIVEEIPKETSKIINMELVPDILENNKNFDIERDNHELSRPMEIVMPNISVNESKILLEQKVSDNNNKALVKYSGSSKSRKDTQQYDRVIKNVITDISLSSKNNKKSVSDMVFSYLNDRDRKLDKGDLKKMKDIIIKDMAKIKAIESKDTDLQKSGVVVPYVDRQEVTEFEDLSNSEQVINDTEVNRKRIHKIRKIVIKNMKVTTIDSIILTKLDKFIVDTIRMSPDNTSDVKIASIVIEVKNNKKAAENYLEVTNEIRTDSQEVDEVIDNIGQIYGHRMVGRNNQGVRKVIAAEISKSPNAPMKRITKRILKLIKKKKKDRKNKMTTIVLKSMKNDIDAEIDENLSTKHRDLYKSYLKESYKNNDTKLPESLSKKVIAEAKDILKNNKTKNKKIFDLNNTKLVPFNILE